MAILMIFTTIFLSALTQYISAELHPQFNTIDGTSKYVYSINPVANGQFHNLYQVGNNIPRFHNAQNRAGYNYGKSYDGVPQHLPLYTEKKVTTIRKRPARKQSPKFHKIAPPFKPIQLGGGKWFKLNQGYGKHIPSFGGGINIHAGSPIGFGKGNNFKPNTPTLDLINQVNSFNKQIEQINKQTFDEKFKQDIPRYNENSFGQNKAPFDYVPVNLDSNNYSPFNSHNVNSVNSIPSEYKMNNILKTNWHQNSAPVNAEPVKYATFVPGIDAVDTTSGKIHSQSSPIFESYLGKGKGGDPSSFVKVTNGKVTYSYNIRHLPNKH